MTSSTHKLCIFLIIYIISICILSAIGLYGDQSKDSLSYALNFFSNTDQAISKSFFNYILSIHTMYKIFLITLLFVVIHKKIYLKIDSWLNKKFHIASIKIFFSALFILLCIDIVRLPFNIFYYFKGKEFGIIKSSFSTWLLRYLASNSISTVAAALAITVLILIILRSKKFYFYIPLVFFILSIGITIIYPRFITPLFYEMTRIQDKILEKKIAHMFEKANIVVKEIYVIDKSKYSNSVNAYMIGFGNERRIVLYDTLLKKFTHDEILSVVAHELCHYIEEHVLIGIILGSLGILGAFLLLQLCSRTIFNLDIKELLAIKNHPLLAFCIFILLFLSAPAENILSRIMERRADAYALELTQNPESFLQLTIRMAKENKSDILPHPAYAWFYRSHPTILERIKEADNRLKKR